MAQERKARFKVGRRTGRPRLDQDADPAIVKALRAWAEDADMGYRTISAWMIVMRRFHKFLVARKGRDYYRSKGEGARDFVDWRDAQAWLEHCKALTVARDGKTVNARRITKVKSFEPVYRFFQYRAASDPSSDKYADELAHVERLGIKDSKGRLRFLPHEDETSEGHTAFESIDVLRMIVAAADSYSTVRGLETPGAPETMRGDFPSEDGIAVRLLLYTGARAQVFGLMWQDVDLVRGLVKIHTKGVNIVPLADQAPAWDPKPILEVLREFRAANPDRRMVFRNGRCSYRSQVPWPRVTTCRECGARGRMRTYYAPDGDVPLCRSCEDQELKIASRCDQDGITDALKRVEAALPPGTTEEVFDAAKNDFVRVPLRIRAHRFRKMVVTTGKESGMSADSVAKLSTHKTRSMIDETYNKPSIASKRDAADTLARAYGGERQKSDLEKLQEQLAEKDKLIVELTREVHELVAELRGRNGHATTGDVTT